MFLPFLLIKWLSIRGW